MRKEKGIEKEMEDIEKKLKIQKETALEIAECLDLIFNTEEQLKRFLGEFRVKVNYFISHQEGSEIFFAEFVINSGLTEIKRTFLFDIYNKMAGFQPDKRYLENEIKRFLLNVKKFIQFI